MTRKTAFFEEWSWFKFDNLRLEIGTNVKLYTNVVVKELKLIVIKFWVLIPTFLDFTGEKLVRWGGPFCHPPPFSPSWLGQMNLSKKCPLNFWIYKRKLILIIWFICTKLKEEVQKVLEIVNICYNYLRF